MKFSPSTISLALAGLAAAAPVDMEARWKGTSKRGVLYTDPSLPALFPAPAMSWSYNYQSSAGTEAVAGQEFVPMLFDGSDSNWQSNVQAALANGTKHLLAFNEPDQPTSAGGTNIDPNTAASTYQSMMNPFSGQAKLGAPAVSAGGISWLQQFAQACAGNCKIDFIPLHFYASESQSAQDQATSLQGFMESTIPQVRGFFNNPSLPIWITEFAALPNTNINVQLSTDYMDSVLPYLRNSKDIARFSYFFANELAANGAVNGAGDRYLNHST